MAWERRKGSVKVFFYEARREGPAVKKVYLSTGPAAQMAARRVAERRAARARAARTALELRARRRTAEVLLDQEYEAVMLATGAVLYGAGYWRPGRHGWRRWHAAVRELRAVG